MAREISMNGRKKIESIQKEFTEKFNYLTLIFLDEDMKSIDVSRSLAEVRTAKGPDISIMASLKVNTLEQRFMDSFGITVEVAYSKDGKVMHTKNNVDKTLNEMNRWCEENGCDKFEFKKSLRGTTVLSLQEQLYKAIVEQYPDAVSKKMNKDNFMDLHLPSLNSKKGTHIFFNTTKEGIKFGFYCRDEEFVKSILDKSSSIEQYAQGVRPAGNPIFTNVDEAAQAALDFIWEMTGQSKSYRQNNVEEISNDLDDFHVEDSQLIHTLVLLYCALANQPEISDSSLDVLIDRIKSWDFSMSDDEKNNEIIKAFTWFTNNYDPSLFSKLKIKLNELSELDEEKRIQIIEDLRLILATFFEIPAEKNQLYSSVISNLRFNSKEYGIDLVTSEMIDNFNDQFDEDYKSSVLENFCEEGFIKFLSIDVREFNKAIEEKYFSGEMLHFIGKAELGDWESVKKITSKEEAATLKKDFKGSNPEYIVLLYCQGNYIHAFSSE